MTKEYFLFALLCLNSSLIIAQIPQQINYQGMLSDIAGNPITGTYTFNFSIYSDGTTSTSLWTETQSVNISNGLFNIQLGFNNPIPIYLFDGTDKYLGIQVGTEPEMRPRQKLTSVGYSFKAADAVTLNGLPSSSFANASHNHNSVYYTKSDVNTNDGTPNQTEDPISWTKLRDIPAGFADGTDDGGSTTHDHFGESWVNTNPYYGLSIQNTGGDGITGISNSNVGIIGKSLESGTGVLGQSESGIGVAGNSQQSTGVYGSSVGIGESARGVHGLAPNGIGVLGFGETGISGASTSGTGVSGSSTGAGANAIGVFGEAQGGYGVQGNGSVGVYGTGQNSGVLGESTSGFGVSGSSNNVGVVGNSYGSGEAVSGVLGQAPSGYGVKGNGSIGVGGESSSSYGVYGVSQSSYGVYGFSVSDYGIWGAGMYGTAGSGDIGLYGLGKYYGIAANGGDAGVYGFSSTGYGVYGFTNSGTAGGFDGNVNIWGTLWKSGGAFRIDHPLDPANKYLQHSFVESPDMKNIYDGTVILNPDGEAVVTLPDWFEALNKDFRYQLTCIGSYAQVYIAEKISNNRFKIAGGTTGLEVSWQVTGIRKDEYAVVHPIEVEVDKPSNEKGKYIFPQLFGASEESGINYEQTKRMREMERPKDLNVLPGNKFKLNEN